jgi:hypothetical protein
MTSPPLGVLLAAISALQVHKNGAPKVGTLLRPVSTSSDSELTGLLYVVQPGVHP